jgi:hypothetical protein
MINLYAHTSYPLLVKGNLGLITDSKRSLRGKFYGNEQL